MKSLVHLPALVAHVLGVIAWAGTALNAPEASAARCVLIFLPLLWVPRDALRLQHMYTHLIITTVRRSRDCLLKLDLCSKGLSELTYILAVCRFIVLSTRLANTELHRRSRIYTRCI